jgi:hypothetical protein
VIVLEGISYHAVAGKRSMHLIKGTDVTLRAFHISILYPVANHSNWNMPYPFSLDGAEHLNRLLNNVKMS